MCTTMSGVEIIGEVVSGIANVGNKVVDLTADRKNSEYKQQIALRNAKLLEEQAKYQKQIGIQKSREEKIRGVQLANYQKALDASKGIDVDSSQSVYQFEDIINKSEISANQILDSHNQQSSRYFQQADYYRQEALLEEKESKNNLFKFALQGLGSTRKVSGSWFNNQDL